MVPLCGHLLDRGASFAMLFGVLAALSLVTAGIALALPAVVHDRTPHAAG